MSILGTCFIRGSFSKEKGRGRYLKTGQRLEGWEVEVVVRWVGFE